MGVAPDRAKNESWAAFLILCLLVGGQAAGLAAGPPNVRHMGEGGWSIMAKKGLCKSASAERCDM